MSNVKRILFDLDGTLAEWRAAASPEDLMKRYYFLSLKEHEDICKYANDLAGKRIPIRVPYEVYTISAYIDSEYALREKIEWVTVHAGNINKDHRFWVPYGVNKARFYMELTGRDRLTKDDILVDDYSINLRDWETAGGKAIKWLNPINGRNGTFQGARCKTVPELHKIIFT